MERRATHTGRRRRLHGHENHERWLVSYADFITLCFALFVVMFASSQSDKARAISESVRAALDQGRFSTAMSIVLGRGKHEADRKPLQPDPNMHHETPPPPPPPQTKTEQQPADLAKSMYELQKGLGAELESGKIQVRLESRGLIVSLREAGFFASGDDAVAPASIPALAKIAAVIRDLPNPIRLEGHSDSRPIHNSRFRSNWDLSTARAIAMLELLRDRLEITAGRMSVAGYAENAPSDTNESEEGRAHNRRVDVVILSAEGMKSEPK